MILGLICILMALKVNYSMALDYANASGKTQALYGITNLNRFYYAIIGMGGLVVGIISMIREKKRIISLVFILVSIASIIITFMDIWKIFI